MQRQANRPWLLLLTALIVIVAIIVGEQTSIGQYPVQIFLAFLVFFCVRSLLLRALRRVSSASTRTSPVPSPRLSD